jgi:diadenosine tetraphosphate (Ap4A) HIT family hydrolase
MSKGSNTYISDKPIQLNSTSLSLSAVPTSNKIGFSYVFPQIIIIGNNILKKQNLLKILIGLDDINFIFSRQLDIYFYKSLEEDDFVIMGGFGSNTYKNKTVNRRLVHEDIDNIDKPFKIEIFSKNIIREYKLIILPINTKYLNESDIVIDSDSEYDLNKIALEHINKAKLEIKLETKISDRLNETYDFYTNSVLRYAQRQDKTVFFDIINKKTNEEILYECDDFIMVRDILWDGKDINNMHYLIILKNPKYMSIRDLSKTDVELLNTILCVGKQQIEKRHDISNIKMETYFHYHPSIWLVHIHFVSSSIEEKHKKFMVNDVIDNLCKDTDYYRKNSILL